MKKWLPNWRIVSLLSVMALFLAGCGKPYLSTLQPVGEVADMQKSLILLSSAIMILVVVVVSIIFVYVVVKFRQRKGEKDIIPKQVEGSHKLEITWTVIPILLLLILAVPTVSYTFQLADVAKMDEEDSDALVVNVTAHLYWWEFEYPGYGVVTSQDLYVPTDERIYFNLEASQVKHSFWIPSAGGKMDTNTDNTNRFWLSFDSERVGQGEAESIFHGKCAELCGPSHALMDFKVKPVARADFDQWIENMQATEHTAETELAQAGEEIFNQSCITCHAIGADAQSDAGVAPNLTNFGDRERIAGILEHTPEELARWLKDPEDVKPANLMTNTYGELNAQEVDALVEYLMSLKVDEE
ncbi:cytochrome c oxidase subunit II [Sutcliffiella rhizosphaerae]|uniref:Cytochrome c oxidase subunit 2 n=1 Tax=Sutcliffiella rhizosphaerae TaxID=2880967 RepID=A0ABM8YJ01_9BACI|nr:cytochrome c oxidase subunit II [Sutcliffiella rhizosphaerae]CAG9619850.1 Cytochrome c oxidase subunit 2 [Sutcliffiella rhizosphaerae]